MSTPFERATRDWLRAGADGLDGRLRSRLNRARQRALEELPSPVRRGFRPTVPMTAAVGGALLALALWSLPARSPQEGAGPAMPMTAVLDDADLPAAAGEGLLDEDPALYALASLQDAPR